MYGCWAIVFYLLWREVKRHPEISPLVWVPTLWFMRCGSRGVDFWIGGGEDGGRWDPILILLLIIVGVAILTRRRCNWSGIFAHNSALIFFYVYLVVSTLWVENMDNPFVKMFRPLGDLVMALVVATEKNPRTAIIAMCRRGVILLIPMSVVLIRYYGPMGCLQAKHGGNDIWTGVTTHKNPLGQLCIVASLVFIWQLMEARKDGRKLYREFMPWVYLVFTLYLFNGGGNADSRSSTAFLCLLIALGMFVTLGWFRKRPEQVITFIIRGAVALILLSLVLAFFDTSLQALIAQTQGKDATLSDRTYIWQDVIRIGMENPVLGSGYGGFWVPSVYAKLSPIVDNKPMEAHNGYLETFANLGFVGCILLAWVLFQSISSATKVMHNDFEYGRLRLALLFMILVMNYSEATFPVGNHLWWFGFLVVAVYAEPWLYDTAEPRVADQRRPHFEREEDAYIG